MPPGKPRDEHTSPVTSTSSTASGARRSWCIGRRGSRPGPTQAEHGVSGPGSTEFRLTWLPRGPFISTPAVFPSVLTRVPCPPCQVPGRSLGIDLTSPTLKLSPSLSPGTALSQLSCPGGSCWPGSVYEAVSSTPPTPLPVSTAHARNLESTQELEIHSCGIFSLGHRVINPSCRLIKNIHHTEAFVKQW